MFTAPASLPDDPAALKAVLSAALTEIERLHQLIAGLQRHRFGRRSEKLDDAAVEQGPEDLGQALAEQQAGLEAAAAGLAIRRRPISTARIAGRTTRSVI